MPANPVMTPSARLVHLQKLINMSVFHSDAPRVMHCQQILGLMVLQTDADGGWMEEKTAHSSQMPDQAISRNVLGPAGKPPKWRAPRHLSKRGAAAAPSAAAAAPMQTPGLLPPNSIQVKRCLCCC